MEAPQPQSVKGDGNATQIRTRYRKAWLNAVKTHPHCGMNDLRRLLPKESAWLRHNDNVWLTKNKPKRKPHIPSHSKIDWTVRDQEFALLCSKAAEKLYSSDSQPARIVPVRILREAGILTKVKGNYERLPKTKQILEELTESSEHYYLRRIQRVLHDYQDQNIEPPDWEFIHRVSIPNDGNLRNELTEALQEALDRLRGVAC